MEDNINFSKGLVPCIIQDATTNTVLMLGFMNEEAYSKTLSEKKVTFFSRSKQRLWTKGETSGNYLEVIEILKDCDQDSLLIKVNPAGPVCHTGADTCFEKSTAFSLQSLEQLITDRNLNPKPGSYTSDLFKEGINRIAQKVGEEAVELVIEAKDDNRNRFLNEAADLLFHYLVLLQSKKCSLNDVLKVLNSRHNQPAVRK